MTKKVGVLRGPLVVRYKGVYDYEGLYKLLITFLEDRKFDIEEKKYKDKQAGPFGHEVEHKHKAAREVTEFIQYQVSVSTHFWDVKEFVANAENGKKKLTSGKFEIVINGSVIFDWQDNYKSDFWKKFLDFYVDTLFKKYYEENYLGQLETYLFDLQKALKKHANMEGQA